MRFEGDEGGWSLAQVPNPRHPVVGLRDHVWPVGAKHRGVA
jgi:hypothetical protein